MKKNIRETLRLHVIHHSALRDTLSISTPYKFLDGLSSFFFPTCAFSRSPSLSLCFLLSLLYSPASGRASVFLHGNRQNSLPKPNSSSTNRTKSNLSSSPVIPLPVFRSPSAQPVLKDTVPNTDVIPKLLGIVNICVMRLRMKREREREI